MKVVVINRFGMACKVIKVNSQLSSSSSSGPTNALLSHFQIHSHSLPTLGRNSLTRRAVSETQSNPLHCSCRTRQRRVSHTLGLWCTLPTVCSPGHRPSGSQRGGGPGRHCRLNGYVGGRHRKWL